MEKNNESDNSELGNSNYLKWIVYAIIFIAIIIFKAGAKKEIRKNVIDSTLNSDQVTKPDTVYEATKDTAIFSQIWFANTQHGLSFETPKAVKGGKMEIPQGTEDYFAAAYSYILQQDNLAINYSVMDTYYKTYDTKLGLKGAINNLLNTANATDLNLEFTKQKGKYNCNTCIGNLKYRGVEMTIRGYCLFNKGRLFIIIGSGQGDGILEKKLDRIFRSIKIV